MRQLADRQGEYHRLSDMHADNSREEKNRKKGKNTADSCGLPVWEWSLIHPHLWTHAIVVLLPWDGITLSRVRIADVSFGHVIRLLNHTQGESYTHLHTIVLPPEVESYVDALTDIAEALGIDDLVISSYAHRHPETCQIMQKCSL